jgi:transposase-like protein
LAQWEKKGKGQGVLLVDHIDLKKMTEEKVLGQNGLVKHLTERLLQRVLETEMDGHLGYEKHDSTRDNSGDSRNGYSEKTVLTENHELTVAVPRDRNGIFDPTILPKMPKACDSV